MKTEKMVVEIEGFSPILFDRLWELEQSLHDETASKGAVSHFTPEQFYSIDEEICFLVKKNGKDRDLTVDEIEAIQKDQIIKNKIVPAIPIKHWLDGAMFGVAGQVKVSGKKTIKDFINSTFTIVESRCPLGKTEHFFEPEHLDKSLPSNKQGARHYSEKPGFKEGWRIKFHVQFMPEFINKAKIRECIERAGWMKGIGARRKAGNGKFVVLKVS